jgi:muconolactone delta-isomerase
MRSGSGHTGKPWELARLATCAKARASEGRFLLPLNPDLPDTQVTRKPMRNLPKTVKFLPAFTLLFVLVTGISSGQEQSSNSATVSQSEVERIVAAFTAKETEFRKALNEYSFKRDAIVQSVGMGQQVTGEYHRVSLFTFDDSGRRYEKITFFPMASFQGVTQEDIEDLGGIQPFALEPSKIPVYNFRYVGKEKIDELSLYVFDVSPKVMPDAKKTKERFFTGRVWVDDRDLQIVKTRGKGVPETKINKFPTVETYREQIDGRYWFPTYSYADEELIFDSGDVLHIRMQVKYSDFAKARAKVTITESEDPDAPKKETPPTPSKPKKP